MIEHFNRLRVEAISLGFTDVIIYNVGNIGLFELRVLHENPKNIYIFHAGFAKNPRDGIMEY
jgi:hypothetical protein